MYFVLLYFYVLGTGYWLRGYVVLTWCSRAELGRDKFLGFLGTYRNRETGSARPVPTRKSRVPTRPVSARPKSLVIWVYRWTCAGGRVFNRSARCTCAGTGYL